MDKEQMTDTNPTPLFDCLILGAGPAGLSATLALCRVNLTAAIFSTSTFRNDSASHAHGILTRDHVPPSRIHELGRQDIERYGSGVRFVDAGIVSAHKINDTSTTSFEATDSNGQKWRGKKIILAMGSRDIFPADLEGYAQNWGKNIYQCLFCDGYEHRHRPAAVLGFQSPMSLHFVHMLAQLGCPEVVILGNGGIDTEDENVLLALQVAKYEGFRIDERKVVKLVDVEADEEGSGVDVIFDSGEPQRFGFLVHRPSTAVVGKAIAEQLGVEVLALPSGDEILKRNEPFGESNVKGVFVAGDVGTPLKHAVGAMYSGSCAAAGVNLSLGQDRQERALQEIKGANKDVLA